ncbi:hypothetical protein K5549_019802, partial [Capra hircus]
EDLAANHRGVPFKLQSCLSSLDSSLLLHGCFGGVRHPSGKVTESAGGQLSLPQDLRWKSTGLGVWAIQSIYELTRRHNASPFNSGPP